MNPILRFTPHATSLTRPGARALSTATGQICWSQRLSSTTRPLSNRILSSAIVARSRNYATTSKQTDSVSASSPATREASKPKRQSWRPAPHRNPNEPVYELFFTCKRCKHRSGKTVSKQGYHNGTVVIKCDGCGNRHLISDHLKIFSDSKITLEEILSQHGESMQRGGLNQDGDVELWSNHAVDNSLNKAQKENTIAE